MARSGEVLGQPPERPWAPDPHRIVRQPSGSTWTFDSQSISNWVSAHRHNTGSLGLVTLPADFSNGGLTATKALASQLIGMDEDAAWSIVRAANREWEDATGADVVTADLRAKRIRVVVEDGIIRNAIGG
jgi:hypothetical protein